MNKLEQMIQELCPNGVEFRRLSEVCEIKTGKGITKKIASDDGEYPIISGGKEPMGNFNEYNREANTVTISRVGANAGYINYIEKRFYLNDKCFSIIPFTQGIINEKYLFYYLKDVEPIIISLQSEGGVPTINTKKVGNLEVPLPPLSVQLRIVEVLDSFTNLQKELEMKLQDELKARQKQYECYRDKLLTFNKLQGGVWQKMSEVFEIRNGYTPSKANDDYWIGGTIPWFRLEDIRENGRILSDSILHITEKAVKGTGLFPANSIIISTTATIGEHALVLVPSLTNQQFSCLSIRNQFKELLDIKFVYYYCFIISELCKRNVNKGGFAILSLKKLKNFEIPIPSLDEQRRIVDILYRLEDLVSDISGGLSAEISSRKAQYEYYRNKLLTFKRRTA